MKTAVTIDESLTPGQIRKAQDCLAKGAKLISLNPTTREVCHPNMDDRGIEMIYLYAGKTYRTVLGFFAGGNGRALRA